MIKPNKVKTDILMKICFVKVVLWYYNFFSFLATEKLVIIIN